MSSHVRVLIWVPYVFHSVVTGHPQLVEVLEGWSECLGYRGLVLLGADAFVKRILQFVVVGCEPGVCGAVRGS